MPNLSKTYHDELQSFLDASPFVYSMEISLDDRRTLWFLRGDVYFIDNSRLHFRELYFQEPQFYKKTYVYHYQDKNEKTIFRYDNAPHYPNLENAPHHKHIGDATVVSASIADMEDVISEIELIISKENR